MPTAALAEGSFSSSLSGVSSGFISRTWTDRAVDSASTATYLAGCTRNDGATFFLEVDLRKKRTLAPDVSYGRKNVSGCTSSATANWGNPGSGDFFDQFWHYNFGQVSARTVTVRY